MLYMIIYFAIGLFLASVFMGVMNDDLGGFLFGATVLAWPLMLGILAIGGLALGIIALGHKIGDWISDFF